MVMKWIRGEGVGREWGDLGYVQLDSGEQVRVERETDTQSPNVTRKPSFWFSVRTLLLASGQEVYGCADCWYAADNPRQVMPHRNAHRQPKLPKVELPPSGSADAELDEFDSAVMAVQLLVHKARQVDHLIKDRDEWKARAKKAESIVAQFRRAMGRVVES